MNVPLLVQSVYKKGIILIRFLGAPSGILLHRRKDKTVPCPGEATCPDHDLPKWKGYAAAQRWDQTTNRWIPVVFELTEGAVSCTGTEDLRGQCWEFQRQKTSYASQEVVGQLRARYDSALLPPPFDIVPVVERLYKTRRIEWGVNPELYSRPTAETSEDAPPIKAPAEKRPAVVTPEELEKIKRAHGQVFQPIGDNKNGRPEGRPSGT